RRITRNKRSNGQGYVYNRQEVVGPISPLGFTTGVAYIYTCLALGASITQNPSRHLSLLLSLLEQEDDGPVRGTTSTWIWLEATPPWLLLLCTDRGEDDPLSSLHRVLGFASVHARYIQERFHLHRSICPHLGWDPKFFILPLRSDQDRGGNRFPTVVSEPGYLALDLCLFFVFLGHHLYNPHSLLLQLC